MLVPTPRSAAASALLQRERGADFIEPLLDRAIDEARLLPSDRALCRELGLGCVRWQGTLDWLIGRRSGGREQKPPVRVLLRLGLYQLLWLDRIPPHAAVNESVELARQLGCGPQSGFVNAMLRAYARERDSARKLLEDLKASQPDLGWSHPAWLVDRWTANHGRKEAVALLEWNNTPADTCARVNTLKTDPGRLLERWRLENVEYDFIRRDWLPENLVFRLRTHPPLIKLGSFRDGWFYVQDPSTLLAPLLLDPQPGESVLDLCAAPGGKTTFLAQMMKGEGRIVACDSSAKRLQLLQENTTRLGVACIEPVQIGQVSDPQAGIPGAPFDRVLVDAPCSNTGVMRRRVDLRWRIQPAEVRRLTGTQLQLLNAAAQRLKPGGCLVYSTCSLEPEENAQLVQRFLSGHPDFALEDQQEATPMRDQVDGAYAATLKRVR
ncbi:MAG: 16S rRNA (cytosine(967)-C(5))-methyltransferase RsmB [Verrucomicrobia bacterium]|nr:16S rRNA (cytosine(967)-C(5))-methyltransferase RsmB [Verrucomicrobiota bacterium]